MSYSLSGRVSSLYRYYQPPIQSNLELKFKIHAGCASEASRTTPEVPPEQKPGDSGNQPLPRQPQPFWSHTLPSTKSCGSRGEKSTQTSHFIFKLLFSKDIFFYKQIISVNSISYLLTNFLSKGAE